MSSTSWLAFSCSHIPLHDPEAIDFLKEQIVDFKPQVIISLGDDFEAQASSRWPSVYPWNLKDEFTEFDKVMEDIRFTGIMNGTTRFVKLWGNHGNNIMRVNRVQKDLVDLVNPYDHCRELQEWETPCEYVADAQLGCFRIGQVTFAHGYETGGNSDELQAIKYGLPYGLFVSGHTHRPVPVRQAMRTKTSPLPYYYANAGCLRQMCPDYVRVQNHMLWGQAVVVGEAADWRYKESMIPNSPQWDAETRIFRMATGTKPDQPDWRK